MATEIERQFAEIDAAGWDLEFMALKLRCDQESRLKGHTLEASKALDNRKYNRYRDVNPYDHSRILLARSAVSDTDYINANMVKCESADRQYILTQGPLPLTVSHFWLMVWEQKSKAILMLNKLIEKKAVKCHQYWPDEIGPEYKMSLTDVQLDVEYVKYEELTGHFSIRTLLLTDKVSGSTREVLQFHYTTWPDFGIPSSPNDFLRFLKMVRDSGAMDPSVGPVIVHCSAGIGRSGTFCLVDCCLTMVERQQKDVSVSDVLSELRSYRMGLIQTPDQLYFSYLAIIDGIKYFNDEEWINTPIASTIKYRENGVAEEEDDVPPPLPPPRTESLAPAEEPEGPSKWSQQPLPMIPIEEDDGSASDTDVESCNSSNEENTGLEKPEETTAHGVATATTAPEEVKTNGGDDSCPAEDGPLIDEPSATDRDTLRRRHREEKQHLMSEKVLDIKRKQREVEDGVVASKKRRSCDADNDS